jgi:hypothetical protein
MCSLLLVCGRRELRGSGITHITPVEAFDAGRGLGRFDDFLRP